MELNELDFCTNVTLLKVPNDVLEAAKKKAEELGLTLRVYIMACITAQLLNA